VLLPGSGLSTATGNAPAEAALPVAVSCVEETKVVVRTAPLRRTLAPETKLLPVRLREKSPRLVEVGEIPVSEGVGFRRVTAEVENFVASATLVAVTETVFGEGRAEGAVYAPEELMVPRVAVPPGVVFTDQVTEVLEEPVTAAEKE